MVTLVIFSLIISSANTKRGPGKLAFFSWHIRQYVTAVNHTLCTGQLTSCMKRYSDKLLHVYWRFLCQILFSTTQQVAKIQSLLILCNLLRWQNSVIKRYQFPQRFFSTNKVVCYRNFLLPTVFWPSVFPWLILIYYCISIL